MSANDGPSNGTPSGGRRFGASRLRRRSTRPAPAQRPIEVLDDQPQPIQPRYDEFDTTPRGTFRVVGCSPGCLMVSLVGSVVLTILLNLFLRVL